MNEAIERLQERIDLYLLLWVNAADEREAKSFMKSIRMMRKRMRILKRRRFWSGLWNLEVFG